MENAKYLFLVALVLWALFWPNEALAFVRFLLRRVVLRGIFMLVTLIGTLIEIPRRRKIDREEIPYELPLAYRLFGWQIGGPSPGEPGWITGIVTDKKTNRMIPISRRTHVLVRKLIGK